MLEIEEPEVEMIAVEKVSPPTSLFVVLDEEEVKTVTSEPIEPKEEVITVLEPTKTMLSGEEINLREESAEPSPAREEKIILFSEGKSVLLFGGAAAVAILAMAVGVALALRKN